MSSRQLLEKLESLGIIDEKVLDKVRKHIEDPNRTLKPKAILSYLIKKKQITEAQAARLLGTPKTEDEIEVVQPVEKSYDTSDLTGLTPPSVTEPEKDYGVTLEDVGQIDEPAEVIEVHPEPDASVVYEAIDLDVDDVHAANPMGGLQNGGFENVGMQDVGFVDGGFGSGAYGTQSGEQKEVKLTFAGKRDQNDQWATKWLYIGFGVLGTVLIGMFLLWIATMGQQPEDMFKAAMNSYDKQSWGDAVNKFEDFLEAYPNDSNAPKARIRRIQSIIRGTHSTKNWKEVLQQAETLLPELNDGKEVNMDVELRDDLGVMLTRALVEITEQATQIESVEAMETQLVTINAYKKTMDNPVYIPNSVRKRPSIAEKLSKIDNNIRAIVGQIDKEKNYAIALEKILGLREKGETDLAFEAYQKLTRNYGDLASREELREMMLTISEKEMELVRPASTKLSVFATERDSIIASSIMLAVKSGTPVERLQGEIKIFLADGTVYGIDAGDGTIVWSRFVGYETSIQPVAIDDDTIAIVNQKTNELISVQKSTGVLVWRTEIGEPFVTPTIGDRLIVVTTESGKVIQLNSASGVAELAAQLPQGANVNALVATRDPYIYQVGYYSNLYVLSSQDFSCKQVINLGHYKGSIVVPPVAWSGYILVAINRGGFCDLHVFKPENNGLGLRLVQVVTRITNGSVSTPLRRFGRSLLLSGDNGEMRILDLNVSDEENPVRRFASDRFDTTSGQRSFLLTEGSQLWVAGNGIVRYRIRRNQGTFSRDVVTEADDHFISPVQMIDDYIFHVRRRLGSGMISATLADAMTLKPVWRTDFAGQLAGSPTRIGGRIVAVSNQGDVFSIDQSAQDSGYSDQAVRASTVVQSLKFQDLIKLSNGGFACVGPRDSQDMIFVSPETPEKIRLLTLVAPADKSVTRPIALGDDLIIASSSGQVARVNPTNGRLVGAPFQPPVSPGTATPWFEPVVISENIFAVAAGPTEDGTKSTIYLLSGKNRRSLSKLDSLESELPFKSRLVSEGNLIFVVMGPDGNEKLVSLTQSNPLTQTSEVLLAGSVVDGPWASDGKIMMQLDNNKLACFGTDLSKKWSIEVGNERLACAPEMVDGQLMLCFQNGKIDFLDSESGQSVRQFDLGKPILHAPLRDGQKMYFGGMDGTVLVVDHSQFSQ